MIKIGEVSKLTGVPVKTLRYWEEFGLLTPAFVDGYTGYRAYDENNIQRISQIVYLKNLGFSLKEIKTFDDETIELKTNELKLRRKEIFKSIKIISELKKNKKGEYEMKNFVNDPNAIGKWSLLGLATTKDDAFAEKVYNDDEYLIKDLYLMENGEEYWCVGWTKGYVFINDRKNPYQIVGDKMIVAITFDNIPTFYAVYKKQDSIKHSLKDFRTEDNVDLPFKENKKMIGFYEPVDCIRNPKQFYPNKKPEINLYIKKLVISPDGTVFFTFGNGVTSAQKWTENFIISEADRTASKCEFKKIDGDDYMFMEWKSGDYIWGGHVTAYYVFKKM